MADEETKTEPTETAKQEDINNRVNEFLKAYGELVTLHKIDFATYPVFMPDGNGAFKVTIQNTPVDISNSPVKSPFVAKA